MTGACLSMVGAFVSGRIISKIGRLPVFFVGKECFRFVLSLSLEKKDNSVGSAENARCTNSIQLCCVPPVTLQLILMTWLLVTGKSLASGPFYTPWTLNVYTSSVMDHSEGLFFTIFSLSECSARPAAWQLIGKIVTYKMNIHWLRKC